MMVKQIVNVTVSFYCFAKQSYYVKHRNMKSFILNVKSHVIKKYARNNRKLN